ncbi:MAG TPA: flagellar biosynthetic protein FliQ [Anaeromyxobacteraceae bacterium]|nr:flagellar biosynthetic protein FliQ [Anaeromyxobacteraceae bacterium]
MTADLPAALLREGLVQLAVVGGPLFGAILVVGLVVGVLQAATQVNDPAVGFLPRALTVGLVFTFAGGWMMDRLARFLAIALTRMAGP